MTTGSDRTAWRCAVLHGWDPNTHTPTVAVAALSWTVGAAIAHRHLRWLPTSTPAETTAARHWADLFAAADQTLPVERFLAHHVEHTSSLGVTHVTVPAAAVDLPGAADLLLDEVLTAEIADALSDTWYPTDALTAGGVS